MLFALLTFIVAVQAQPPKPQDSVQTVSAPIFVSVPPAPTFPTSAPASVAPAAAIEAVLPEAEAEAEPELEAELPTRRVCRYVEVTGQRFPVRSCRTVTIDPAESD